MLGRRFSPYILSALVGLFGCEPPKSANSDSSAPDSGDIAKDSNSSSSGLVIEVDDTLIPALSTVESDGDRYEAPVSRIQINGSDIDIVSDELQLWANSREEADALAASWGGEVTYDQTDEDDFEETDPMDAAPYVFIARVDPHTIDTSDIESTFLSYDPTLTGTILVSDDAALGLLGIVITEIAAGHEVELDLIAQSDAYEDYVITESSSIENPNPFEWEEFSLDGVQHTGVAEVWRLQEINTTEDNDIELAVIDEGFSTNDDLAEPEDDHLFEVFTWSDPDVLDTPGTDPEKPWHGTRVAGVVHALHDNVTGSAGVATQVVTPIYGLHPIRCSSARKAVRKAARRFEDLRIINLSMSCWMPDPWGFFIGDVTGGIYQRVEERGILVVASAGNQSHDLDEWRQLPCEHESVLCVGALDYGSMSKNSGSNYDGGVDIFAPGTSLWLVGDPDYEGDARHDRWGTSYASPFVAGVAAHLLSVNPVLTPAELREVLVSTESTSEDPDVPGVVNALNAYLTALYLDPTTGDARDFVGTVADDESVAIPLVVEPWQRVAVDIALSSDETYGSVATSSIYRQAYETDPTVGAAYSCRTTNVIYADDPVTSYTIYANGSADDAYAPSRLTLESGYNDFAYAASIRLENRISDYGTLYNTVGYLSAEEAVMADPLVLPADIPGSFSYDDGGARYVRVSVPEGAALQITATAWSTNCNSESSRDLGSALNVWVYDTDGDLVDGSISMSIDWDGVPVSEEATLVGDGRDWVIGVFQGAWHLDDFVVYLTVE